MLRTTSPPLLYTVVSILLLLLLLLVPAVHSVRPNLARPVWSDLCPLEFAPLQPDTNVSYVDPVALPSAWNASFVFVNASSGDTGYGMQYYDYTWGAMRTDFFPACPFAQIQKWELNNVGCSVIFLEGKNYYVYPEHQICCQYDFPVWRPTFLQDSNSTYMGQVTINYQKTDFWHLEFSFNTTIPFDMQARVMRDVYLKAGTNIPVRFNETLTTGWSDFYNVQIGPQELSIFQQPISDAGACHFQDSDGVCVHYCCTARVPQCD